ncbi:MAG: hypothetical protein QNL04_05135 [SAR324 cluster bacterium]|nr:hypothetical protein [SAR324 cluster bacterium]
MMTDPLERAKLKRLNLVMVISLISINIVTYFALGLDLALGSLVGCVVVGLNFFLSQRVAAKILYDDAGTSFALIIYVFKLGASVVILFVAVQKFGIKLEGILIGLSTVVIGVLINSMMTKPKVTTEEQ